MKIIYLQKVITQLNGYVSAIVAILQQYGRFILRVVLFVPVDVYGKNIRTIPPTEVARQGYTGYGKV